MSLACGSKQTNWFWQTDCFVLVAWLVFVIAACCCLVLDGFVSVCMCVCVCVCMREWVGGRGGGQQHQKLPWEYDINLHGQEKNYFFCCCFAHSFTLTIEYERVRLTGCQNPVCTGKAPTLQDFLLLDWGCSLSGLLHAGFPLLCWCTLGLHIWILLSVRQEKDFESILT